VHAVQNVDQEIVQGPLRVAGEDTQAHTTESAAAVLEQAEQGEREAVRDTEAKDEVIVPCVHPRAVGPRRSEANRVEVLS
jgi:hypothetical protein